MSRAYCPKCGKFLSDYWALRNETGGLGEVTGICNTHGIQDISKQDFDYEDFFSE